MIDEFFVVVYKCIMICVVMMMIVIFLIFFGVVGVFWIGVNDVCMDVMSVGVLI